jgi:DNA repair protein RadC
MGWREMFDYAQENPSILMPQDATPHIAAKIMNKKQEHFVVVTLDGAHHVIKTRVVSKGLVNRTIIHPREVFFPAVRDRACAVIVGHNHPSGKVEPSAEDKEVTKRIKDAGAVMGIPLLDHIIVTKSGYYSFLEQGVV